MLTYADRSENEDDPFVWHSGYVRQSYSHFHAGIMTYAHVRSRMLTYAHVCRRMLTYADQYTTSECVAG
jgi:hypothetical protein